jgi:hypothetical protein
MRRMLALGAVAALALVAAPAAAAKEVKKAQVCGPDACTTVDDENARMALMQGGPGAKPPAAAPYYDVRVTMAEGDEEHTWSFAAVPDREVLRADDGTWLYMPPEVTAVVRKYAGDQKPFPASDLIGAAPPPDPTPQPAPAADADSPLWPEGLIIALIAIAAAVLIVRFSGRYRPASG